MHYRASGKVARLLCEGESEREALLAAAAPLTDATTDAARRRAAATVLTRLGLGRRRHVTATGLHRLLGSVSEEAGRQLLSYVVAQHEPLLAAVCTEVLYPHFVQREAPAGFTVEEFSAANANGLFDGTGAITHRAVADYARKRWGLSNDSPTRRALRVLRKGGILGCTWVSRSGARRLGHFPVIRIPDIAPFAYALHAMREEGGYVRLDRLRAGLPARLFLMEPVGVDYLLGRAASAGLMAKPRSGTANLPFDTLDAAAAAILQAHHAGR